MLVYRYEMPDGGGAFFTLDGVQRRTGIKFPSEYFVCGCKSKEQLDEYFHHRIPENCRLIIREIPDELVKDCGNQVIFPKSFIRGGY